MDIMLMSGLKYGVHFEIEGRKNMADINTPINEMGLYKVYRKLCNRNDAKQCGNKMSEKERAEIIRLHSEGVP